MKTTAFAVPAVLAGLLVTPAAKADHEGRFDFQKTLTMTGTLARVAWGNPRIYLYVDVKNAEGRVEQWMVITGNPAQLGKAGITDKTQLAVGGTYKLDTNPELRPGSAKVAFLTSLTFPDGHAVKLGM